MQRQAQVWYTKRGGGFCVVIRRRHKICSRWKSEVVLKFDKLAKNSSRGNQRRTRKKDILRRRCYDKSPFSRDTKRERGKGNVNAHSWRLKALALPPNPLSVSKQWSSWAFRVHRLGACPCTKDLLRRHHTLLREEQKPVSSYQRTQFLVVFVRR